MTSSKIMGCHFQVRSWAYLLAIMTRIMLGHPEECGLHFGHLEIRRLGQSILWLVFL